MLSGVGDDGPPLPIVVDFPNSAQKAVDGSGLPSSSSSEVVNFKHILYSDRV
jgi:hypothetical protein